MGCLGSGSGDGDLVSDGGGVLIFSIVADDDAPVRVWGGRRWGVEGRGSGVCNRGAKSVAAVLHTACDYQWRTFAGGRYQHGGAADAAGAVAGRSVEGGYLYRDAQFQRLFALEGAF